MTVYSWGMQPAFDYLIGRKLYDVIRTGKNIQIEYTNGIYQMLSLIVIEEDGKLISEYSNIKLEESALFDLICYTLANTSVEIASKYHDYVKKLMQYSEAEFREIVNKVIIPVSKIDNHPLGGNLLDEFLRSFDKPAQRDIWRVRIRFICFGQKRKRESNSGGISSFFKSFIYFFQRKCRYSLC